MATRIVIPILLFLVGCTSSPVIRHSLEFTDMTPLEFLTHLERHETRDCYYMRSVPRGWVKEEHLPRLFGLLDSDKESALPVSAISSPHEDMGKGSTVGSQAGLMIRSFRTHAYPAPLGSRISDTDKEDLRAWWRQYQKKKD